MAASALPPSGGQPLADITARMAVFGRLFSEDVGLPDVAAVRTSKELVRVVRSRVPRTTQAGDDSPVFEAAAFVGEWLRSRAEARWVSEGPYEPHLQVTDAAHSVVYLLPLVSVMRVATTAGYDGLTSTLDSVLADVSRSSGVVPLDHLRVQPPTDARRVVAWIRARGGEAGRTRAELWRRCQTCSRVIEDAVEITVAPRTWEAHASSAAAVLASRPFSCPCGGPPGEVSRFLMARSQAGGHKLADIFVGGSFTRVACWSIRGEEAEPYDATALSLEDLAASGNA